MRSKNVTLSIISSFIYQIVLIVTNFILISMIIKYYGSTYNGLNSSVQNVINYLTIVEAGIALSAIHALYKPLVNSDWTETNRIIISANILYKKSGIIFTIILTVVAVVYPFTIISEIPYSTIFIFIFILGLSSLFEFFLNGKYRVLLMGDQKAYIVNIVQTITLLISAVVKILMISFGFNFILVMFVGSSLTMIRYYLSKIYVKKYYKNFNLNNKLDNIFILENKNSVVLHQISGLVVFNTPLIFVSIFVGLESASIYAIYNLIFNGIFMLVTLLTKSSISSFGHLLIKDDNDKIKKVFYSFQSLFFIIGFMLFTVTFIMIEPFMKLYLVSNSESYFDINLLVLFTIVGILNMIRMPHNIFIEAAGHYKQTGFRALIEAIMNVVFSLIFINIFGIYGVLMGSITSFIYRSLDIIMYASKHILKIGFGSSIFKILINSLVTIIVIYVYFHYSVLFMQIRSWFEWIYVSLITSLSLLFIYGVVNAIINPGLINDVISRIKAIIIALKRRKV